MAEINRGHGRTTNGGRQTAGNEPFIDCMIEQGVVIYVYIVDREYR